MSLGKDLELMAISPALKTFKRIPQEKMISQLFSKDSPKITIQSVRIIYIAPNNQQIPIFHHPMPKLQIKMISQWAANSKHLKPLSYQKLVLKVWCIQTACWWILPDIMQWTSLLKLIKMLTAMQPLRLCLLFQGFNKPSNSCSTEVSARKIFKAFKISKKNKSRCFLYLSNNLPRQTSTHDLSL